MKFKAILSVSACLLAMMAVPTHAQISDQEKATMTSFAEPYGIEKGKQETIYIPPTAHVTEILIFFDESDDTINGMFFYYQPDMAIDPVRSHSVGRLEGKLIRIRMDRRDVINGLEVETSPGGALASFVLNTEEGEKRGFKSTLANGESKLIFGNNLKFAGLTVRADSEKVYAMGLNLVSASTSPTGTSPTGTSPTNTAQNGSGIQIFSADGNTSQPTQTAQTPSTGPEQAPEQAPVQAPPLPAQKTGFAKLVEDFKKGLELGRQQREAEKGQAQNTPSTTTGTNANGSGELTSHSQGVTGLNVAVIHYDFNVIIRGKKRNFPGRLEITKAGSNIWNFYADGQDVQKLTVVRRTNDIIIFRRNENKAERLLFNFSKNEVELFIEKENASGVFERTNVIAGNNTKGKITYKAHQAQHDRALKLASGSTQFKWTPAGVTGHNVAVIHYDFLAAGDVDLEGLRGELEELSGRVEISEEGLNIWNFHKNNRTVSKLIVESRSNNMIIFKLPESGTEDKNSRLSFNLMNKEVEFLALLPNASGELELMNPFEREELKGRITYQARPE